MGEMRGIAKDAAASVSRHMATVVAGLITIPILARTLGASRLGFWSFLGTTAFLLSLCDLGLSSATLRAAAGPRADLAKQAARLAAICTAVLSAPAVAGCIVWMFATADKLPIDQRHDARVAVVIAMLAGVVGAVTQSSRSYAQGQGYIIPLAWARVSGVLTQFVVTVSCLAFGLRLRAVAIGFAAGTLVEAGLGLRAASDGKASRGLPGKADRPELYRVALASMLMNSAVALAMRVDVIVLERVTDLATLGAYSVVQRIVDQGYTLVKQIGAALVPRLGLRAENRGATVSLGTMLVGTLNAVPFTALAIAGHGFIVAWAGSAVDLPILPIALVWFAASATISSVECIATSSMSLSGDALAASRYVMSGAVVNLALSIVGGLLFGAWAVAAATTVGNSLVAVLVWRATRTHLGWSRAQVVATMLPVGVGAAVSGMVAVASLRLGLPSLAATATAIVAGLAIASVPIWRLNRTPMRIGTSS
ncbi:MAG: lipopolysaccharide biosynthesis protein [Deltaproteobacteria bacterium]|nr:lipopolysaccharide biosynthesis protein [Deltaproteobacteria bacterium]